MSAHKVVRVKGRRSPLLPVIEYCIMGGRGTLLSHSDDISFRCGRRFPNVCRAVSGFSDKFDAISDDDDDDNNNDPNTYLHMR